uniref:EGF-like domain-containing protein n=1 Tax=Macrostomum lignano TaxID=282301 RepID=A0A1I8I5R2_9PLAT
AEAKGDSAIGVAASWQQQQVELRIADAGTKDKPGIAQRCSAATSLILKIAPQESTKLKSTHAPSAPATTTQQFPSPKKRLNPKLAEQPAANSEAGGVGDHREQQAEAEDRQMLAILLAAALARLAGGRSPPPPPPQGVSRYAIELEVNYVLDVLPCRQTKTEEEFSTRVEKRVRRRDNEPEWRRAASWSVRQLPRLLPMSEPRGGGGGGGGQCRSNGRNLVLSNVREGGGRDETQHQLVSTLRISRILERDSGNYTCRAREQSRINSEMGLCGRRSPTRTADSVQPQEPKPSPPAVTPLPAEWRKPSCPAFYCLNNGTCSRQSVSSPPACNCSRPYWGARCERVDTGPFRNFSETCRGKVLDCFHRTDRILTVTGIGLLLTMLLLILLISWYLSRQRRRDFDFWRRSKRENERSQCVQAGCGPQCSRTVGTDVEHDLFVVDSLEQHLGEEAWPMQRIRRSVGGGSGACRTTDIDTDEGVVVVANSGSGTGTAASEASAAARLSACRCRGAATSNSIVVVDNWLPGHAGIPGNEAVDEIAKRGSTLAQGTAPVPLAAAQAAVRRHCLARWHQIYNAVATEAASTSSLAWHLACTAGRLPPPPTSDLTRRQERLICQLRADRCPALRGFQAAIGVDVAPICRFCGDGEETAAHLLISCPALTPHRCRLWGPSPEPAAVFENCVAVLNFLGKAGARPPRHGKLPLVVPVAADYVAVASAVPVAFPRRAAAAAQDAAEEHLQAEQDAHGRAHHDQAEALGAQEGPPEGVALGHEAVQRPDPRLQLAGAEEEQRQQRGGDGSPGRQQGGQAEQQAAGQQAAASVGAQRRREDGHGQEKQAGHGAGVEQRPHQRLRQPADPSLGCRRIRRGGRRVGESAGHQQAVDEAGLELVEVLRLLPLLLALLPPLLQRDCGDGEAAAPRRRGGPAEIVWPGRRRRLSVRVAFRPADVGIGSVQVLQVAAVGVPAVQDDAGGVDHEDEHCQEQQGAGQAAGALAGRLHGDRWRLRTRSLRLQLRQPLVAVRRLQLLLLMMPGAGAPVVLVLVLVLSRGRSRRFRRPMPSLQLVQPQLPSPWIFQKAIVTLSVFAFSIVYSVQPGHVDSSTQRHRARRRRGSGRGSESRHRVRNVAPALLTPSASAAVAVATPTAEPAGTVVDAQRQEELPLSQLLLILLVPDRPRKLSVRELGVSLLLLPSASSPSPRRPLDTEQLPVLHGDALQAGGSSSGGVFSVFLDSCDGGGTEVGGPKSEMFCTLGSHDRLAAAASRFCRRCSRRSSSRSRRSAAAASSPTSQLPRRCCLRLRCCCFRDCCCCGSSCGAGRLLDHWSSLSLSVLLRAPAVSPLSEFQWALSGNLQAMSSIAQQKKIVEQLRSEASMVCKPVSECVKDMIGFMNSNKDRDFLVSGFASKKDNPFQEKGGYLKSSSKSRGRSRRFRRPMPSLQLVQPQLPSPWIFQKAIVTLSVFAFSIVYSVQPGHVDSSTQRHRARRRRGSGRGSESRHRVRNVAPALLTPSASAAVAVATPTAEPAGTVVDAQRQEELPLSQLLLILLVPDRPRKLSVRELGVSLLLLPSASSPSPRRPLDTEQLPVLHGDALQAGGSSSGGVFSVFLDSCDGGGTEVGGPKSEMFCTLGSHDRLAAAASRFCRRCSRRSSSRSRRSAAAASSPTSQLPRRCCLRLRCCCFRDCCCCGSSCGAGRLLDHWSSLSLSVLLRAPAVSPLSEFQWALSGNLQAMSSIAQQKKIVEQLRSEASMVCKPVSECVKDMIGFMNSNKDRDFLVSGFASKKDNPFQEKGGSGLLEHLSQQHQAKASALRWPWRRFFKQFNVSALDNASLHAVDEVGQLQQFVLVRFSFQTGARLSFQCALSVSCSSCFLESVPLPESRLRSFTPEEEAPDWPVGVSEASEPPHRPSRRSHTLRLFLIFEDGDFDAEAAARAGAGAGISCADDVGWPAAAASRLLDRTCAGGQVRESLLRPDATGADGDQLDRSCGTSRRRRARGQQNLLRADEGHRPAGHAGQRGADQIRGRQGEGDTADGDALAAECGRLAGLELEHLRQRPVGPVNRQAALRLRLSWEFGEAARSRSAGRSIGWSRARLCSECGRAIGWRCSEAGEADGEGDGEYAADDDGCCWCCACSGAALNADEPVRLPMETALETGPFESTASLPLDLLPRLNNRRFNFLTVGTVALRLEAACCCSGCCSRQAGRFPALLTDSSVGLNPAVVTEAARRLRILPDGLQLAESLRLADSRGFVRHLSPWDDHLSDWGIPVVQQEHQRLVGVANGTGAG